MANILLLDESEVAGCAMQGILTRGDHALFRATTPDDAWQKLREGVVFDLVIMDVSLKCRSGLAFLQRLREDWFWKILPVVIYTADTDSRMVRRALGLKVQNYLIKPYRDESVHTEVAKAVQNPWRSLHFEDTKSFCALANLTPAVLTDMRREVMVDYDRAAQTLPGWGEAHQNDKVFEGIRTLVSNAEAAGVWAGVDYLRDLQTQAAEGNWAAFARSGEYLDFASRLVFAELNPSYTPDCMRQSQEDPAKEAVERARWETADVSNSGPLVDRETLLQHVSTLSGCPVIDSAAAAFQMMADGRADCMPQLLDLVASDPGLCAQVLVAANRINHDDMTAIEDPNTAANLLGEIRLVALRKSLPIAYERHLGLPPLTWANYWMFQVAVGRVARFICGYLDFEYLSANAYTAGLLHDIGKLLLLKLHPFAFSTIVRHAREHKLPLAEAERKYLGCTTRELASRHASVSGLPPVYTNVIRWVDDPETATEHGDLVAMVALARHICLQAGVGDAGEIRPQSQIPLTSTAAWQVLNQRVFPSFEVKKFEVQAQAHCLAVRTELSGRKTGGPESRKTGGPEDRRTGGPEPRGSGLPGFRPSGAPAFRC